MRETDAMLSESQLAMLRKEALVAISCNISSSPRLIASLDVHVVQRSCGQAYTGTGERAGCFQTTARKQVD